jgi:hypothetical protein
LHTGVEGRHFAFVAGPEVVGLVLCVLGRASELFVWVVLVHFLGCGSLPVIYPGDVCNVVKRELDLDRGRIFRRLYI